MQYKGATILVAGLAAQQAAAFGWSDAGSFSCPGNTNNQCSDSQQGGYDWSGLQPGSFDSYGSNQFSGFTCSDGGFGKRDLLSKRGFQQKCITGSLDSNPSMSCGDNEGMSIDQMQISSTHDADIDCEYGMPDGSTCHETHSCSEGGAIFQNSQCGGAKSVTFKPGKNAPPGCSIGVHSVGFHCGPPSSTVPAQVPSSSAPPPPPSSSPPPYQCTGPQCSTSAPPAPPSSAPPYQCTGPQCSSSSPALTPSSSAPPYGCVGPTCSSSVTAPVSSVPPASSAPPPYGCSGADCSSSQAVPTPSSSASAPPPCYGADCSSSSAQPVTSSAPPVPCYGGACSSVPAPSSAPPAPSSAPPAPSSAPPAPCYGDSCSSSAAPASSSSPPVPCYGDSCSSSVAVPVPSSSGSPPCYGAACSSSAQPASSASSAPGCYGSSCSSTQGVPGYASSSSPASPASSSSAPPSYPTPNCPGLLPRCLNTWMYLSGCKDNADANCFCGNEDFIKKVMGCIGAWSGSDSETQAAASYLMGLCAPHVPNNPAIITACPSGVQPAGTPAGYTPSSAGPITSAPAPGKPAPCTTITYSSSVVIPATFTTGVSSGLTCPGSSITTSLVTTVTVPQVAITTNTITTGGTTTQSVGLGAGSPAPAAATPTSAGAVPTGYGTTFGTSFAPTASSSGPPIIPATGAGAKTGSSLAGLLLGAIAALAL